MLCFCLTTQVHVAARNKMSTNIWGIRNFCAVAMHELKTKIDSHSVTTFFNLCNKKFRIMIQEEGKKSLHESITVQLKTIFVDAFKAKENKTDQNRPIL